MGSGSEQTAKVQNQFAKLLEKARASATGNIVKSSRLDRNVRERLIFSGYLSEIIRGWYILTTPEGKGTRTLWHSNYWDFIREYLVDRFGKHGYCLSAESSIEIFSNQNMMSGQIIVITKKPSNQTIDLPFKTSILAYQDIKNFPAQIEMKDGINVIPLNFALCKVPPSYFLNHSLNMEICLKSVTSPSDISRVLLSGKNVSAANRLIGAYKRLGDQNKSEQIKKDMESAGFSIHPVDPFEDQRLFLVGQSKLVSPYSGRILAMWATMREDVVALFPKSSKTLKKTFNSIQELYVQDSYHSLSIEGYQVTPDLIERIGKGDWRPDRYESDLQQRNAFAAKGYHGAFQAVLATAKKAAGQISDDVIQNWYRELFKPAVQAGLLRPDALAGYRSEQVYISGSKHIPPAPGWVLDCMSTYMSCLNNEKSPAVRAILGHFIFVFIHPYTDGNGRIGRFIMNLMLISGGYNWTVIRSTERKRYMECLEIASSNYDIKPFTRFVLSEMNHWKK